MVIDVGTSFSDTMRVSSFVQMRGSIPCQWSQDITKMVAKPAIIFDVSDPYYEIAGMSAVMYLVGLWKYSWVIFFSLLEIIVGTFIRCPFQRVTKALRISHNYIEFGEAKRKEEARVSAQRAV